MATTVDDLWITALFQNSTKHVWGYTKIFPKFLPESEFFRRLCHLDFEQVRFSNVKGVVLICAKPFA